MRSFGFYSTITLTANQMALRCNFRKWDSLIAFRPCYCPLTHATPKQGRTICRYGEFANLYCCKFNKHLFIAFRKERLRIRPMMAKICGSANRSLNPVRTPHIFGESKLRHNPDASAKTLKSHSSIIFSLCSYLLSFNYHPRNRIGK
jgi:hypothetical protein